MIIVHVKIIQMRMILTVVSFISSIINSHWLLILKVQIYILSQDLSRKMINVKNAVYWEPKFATLQLANVTVLMAFLEKPVKVSHSLVVFFGMIPYLIVCAKRS